MKPTPSGPAGPGAVPLVEDARGLLCPIPVIRLAERMRDRPIGGEVLLLADDPAALEDVRAWCKGHRQEFVGAHTQGDAVAIRVKRVR